MITLKLEAKKAYEKYAGKEVQVNGSIGIVCGYDALDPDIDLIVAVQSGRKGWYMPVHKDVIITNQDNTKGYWYANIVTVEEYLNPKED